MNEGDAKAAAASEKDRQRPRCPICGEPGAKDYRPFCSKRCADVDLGRWLSGRYAIPVTQDSDEDGDDPGAAPPAGSPAGVQDD